MNENLENRLRRLSLYVWFEYKAMKTVRFQVVALKLTMGELRSQQLAETVKSAGIDLNNVIGHDSEEVWMWPVAIRAATGHSKIKYGVQFEDWRTSMEIDIGVANLIGGAYHETSFRNMYSIMKRGLLPAGPEQVRASTMFLPFAPWDTRTKEFIRRKMTVPPINCAIFLNAEKMVKYGARLTPNGEIVVTQVIPFSDFDAVLYYDDEGHCPRHLLTTVGETHSSSHPLRSANVSPI